MGFNDDSKLAARHKATEKPLTKSELRAAKLSRQDFLALPRNPIYIVLDSLKCAHNVGTILRLADAALVQKVFICGNTIVPPNRKVKAGSRGAEKWVLWEYRQDVVGVIKELKKDGVFILSAEISPSSVHFSNVDYQFPACLVFGREYDGVSKEVMALSDQIVHLPIYGMTNSLNVSTTASVLIYELLGRIAK